jgi:hypothetical protein
MINANELRAGNWVNDVKGGGYNNPGYVKVISIGESVINEWQDMGFSGGASLKDIHPIPLTPEILDKCGFKERADTGLYSNGKNFFLHHYYLMDDEYCFRYNDYKSYPIRFLHQLQNLYFALTGEELTVNL